ncbi:LysR substrate binding domain protein [compost metagenome]
MDNIEALAILIISGAYLGFLPVHVAAQWVNSGEMQQLAPHTLSLASPFEVITRRGVPAPPILRVFLEDMAASASQESHG